MERETRAICEKVEIRAEPGQPPRLIGYASVFNSKSLPLAGGSFVEVVRPGAFAASLNEGRDVLALLEHDPGLILGRRSAGTLIIGEDDRGLRVEIIPPDTQAGRDAMTNVRLGNLNAMSIGFRIKSGGERWDMSKSPALRELTDVELFDASIVAFPAYPKTEVAMRSLASAQARAELDRRRDARLAQIEAELRRR